MLETNPKTTLHMYIVYQRNKLFMGKYLFLYLYFIFNIWDREKILMIKRGREWKKNHCYRESSGHLRVSRCILDEKPRM